MFQVHQEISDGAPDIANGADRFLPARMKMVNAQISRGKVFPMTPPAAEELLGALTSDARFCQQAKPGLLFTPSFGASFYTSGWLAIIRSWDL